MSNYLNIVKLFYFLAMTLSVQSYFLGSNYIFDLYGNKNAKDLKAYWQSGLIDPQRDAVFEEFYRFAVNCYRFVVTVETYRNNRPNFDEHDNLELLKHIQVNTVLHACQSTLDVVAAYFEAMQNEGHSLPDYVVPN